jgi:hypothetical protein
MLLLHHHSKRNYRCEESSTNKKYTHVLELPLPLKGD